ncbi:phosphoserine phosphatase RsbU/P [uncultured Gammaproteobacteria bacterium]
MLVWSEQGLGDEMLFASCYPELLKLGGDLWGVHPLSDGRVAVYLLDMAGRGVGAALNACRLHTLVQETVGLAGRPAEFLAEINRQAVDLLALGDHATMVHGVIDCTRSTFTFASAGANPPLVLPPGGGEPVGCDAVVGLPLGMSARADYEQRELPFAPGAGLVLYSNAVLDALGTAAGEVADVSALVRLVAESVAGHGLEQGFAAVTSRLFGPAGGGATLTDDLSLVWVERRPV